MVVTPQVKLYYDDVEVGEKIPSQVQELSVPIMMRWCGAAEIFSRDHIDYKYAIDHNLKDIVGSGWWTQARLYKLLTDWVGDSGWVWKIHHQIRANLHPDYILTFWGKVVNKHEDSGLGYVDLEIGVTNQENLTIVPGHANVVLPLKGGRLVPYPFEV